MDSEPATEWRQTDEIRFPLDDYLRRHGWQILTRPRRGPDLWINAAGKIGDVDIALQHVKDSRERNKK